MKLRPGLSRELDPALHVNLKRLLEEILLLLEEVSLKDASVLDHCVCDLVSCKEWPLSNL